MIAELLELNQKAGGSTSLVLVTMKYHTIWQEWTPEKFCANLQKTAMKLQILTHLSLGILREMELLFHFNYFTGIQCKC